MNSITLLNAGDNLDFAIMAFCGDGRKLDDFELYISDFIGYDLNITEGYINATTRYIISY